MTHTPRPDIALKTHPLVDTPPQSVVELDTGALVALAYSATPTPRTTLACLIAAWLVDEDGDPQAVAGVPVLSQYAHTADVQQIAVLGAQGIADTLRALALGEPQAAMPLSAQLVEQVSIRNVIAVALASGAPIDFGG